MRSRTLFISALLLNLLMVMEGCARNPFAKTAQIGGGAASNGAAPGLLAQTDEWQKKAQALDRDNQELQLQVGRLLQENQTSRSEVAALRTQLNDITNLATKLRSDNQTFEEKTQALSASLQKRAGAAITANSSLRNSASRLNLPTLQVREDGDVIRIELPTDTLFDAGGARLNPTAGPLLNQVVHEIQKNFPNNKIGVEGHTDSTPLQGTRWNSLHQLSVGRAMGVHEYMTARGGMSAEQLIVVGHGSNHPILSNATAAGQQRNRRVEVVIYPDTLGGQ